MDERITAAKRELGREAVVLGHHYQRDEVIRFADHRGDSYRLSQQAAQAQGKYIVFCGVHFMAESADVLSRPGQVTMRVVNGVRVAFLGFAPYPWASPLLDIPAAARMVHEATAHADLVVVMMHQGAEGADRTHVPHGSETAFGEDRGNARAFAHAVVDAGAGLVLGSGPHVIRGIELYHHRMIAYSLGNFAGPNTLGLGGALSLSAVLRVHLTSTGEVLGGRWVPLRLERPGVPRYDPSHLSARLVRRLSAEDFGSHRLPMSATGVIGADPAVARR